MQNFRISTTQVKFHQICTLIGSFCWKYIKCQLKKYRVVMSRDTEEWCKIWRKTDLFQKWQEFGEFWSEHTKVSKIGTLIGPLRAKYIMFDLKKCRGVIFHGTEEWCKIWRKTDLWFGKWQEEFRKFSPEHPQKLGPFIQSRKYISLKFTGEFMCHDNSRMMQNLKKNWIVSSKLTWGIWRILTWALENLKYLRFNGLLLTKVYNVWAKKVQRS